MDHDRSPDASPSSRTPSAPSNGDGDHRPHHHAHSRQHAHSHGNCRAATHVHTHVPDDFGFAFALGTGLNAAFVLIEAAAGFYANSMALIADAGHNLTDVLGLLMAWSASLLVKRRPTSRYTYGFGSSTILAALGNAVLLLVAIGAMSLEALERLRNPPQVLGATVIVVALVGIAINGGTAWLFASGRHGDVNVRGAFLHMLADAAISFGVVLSGAVMLVTGWTWLDPLASLVIAVIIVWGTWGLLRDSTRLAMNGVPSGISMKEVRGRLATLPGVTSLHDLHVWPMSTTATALTCHLVIPAGHPGDAFIASATQMLHDEFGIGHATLQLEIGDDAPCVLHAECATHEPAAKTAG